MKITRVGVDLAKNVFQVHGVDRDEKCVWRRKLSRNNWLEILLESIEPGCEIGMEACGSAHHWARKLQGKERLWGISKRGDAYVRCLLVHGARAMIRTAKRKMTD